MNDTVTPEQFIDIFEKTVAFVVDIEGDEIKRYGFQNHVILFIDTIFPPHFNDKAVMLFSAKFLENRH